MKIFTVNVGPSGEKLVTGSTADALPTKIPGKILQGEHLYASGIAISVLPSKYQKVLRECGRLSSEDFSSFDLNVVR